MPEETFADSLPGLLEMSQMQFYCVQTDFSTAKHTSEAISVRIVA